MNDTADDLMIRMNNTAGEKQGREKEEKEKGESSEEEHLAPSETGSQPQRPLLFQRDVDCLIIVDGED